MVLYDHRCELHSPYGIFVIPAGPAGYIHYK